MSDGTFYTASSGGHDSMMPSGQGKDESLDWMKYSARTHSSSLLMTGPPPAQNIIQSGFSTGTFHQQEPDRWGDGHLHGVTNGGASHLESGYSGKLDGHRPKQHSSMADSSESWRSPAFGSSKWQEPSWRSQQRGTWRNDSWRSNKSQQDSSWSARDDITDSLQKISLDSNQQSFGSGGGMKGLIPFGPSNATYRYSTEMLAKIYRQLLYTGRLGLPPSISRDNPMLFTSASEFVDVVEQLQGVTGRQVNGYISMSYSADTPKSQSLSPMNSLPAVFPDSIISPPNEQISEEPTVPQHTQLVEDMYMYVDPQGMWQGPFRRAEILEWHAAGFFPLDLVMKSSSDTSGRFMTLQDLLVVWSGGMYMPNSVPPQVHEHVIEQQNVPVMQQPGDIFVAAPVPQEPDDYDHALESPLAPHNTAIEPIEVPVQKAEAYVVEEPRVRPETKPAPWLASKSSDAMVSLRDIQIEEDKKKTKLETQARMEAQKNNLHKNGWASVTKSTDSLSLKDIQNEELQTKKESNNSFWDYDENKNAPVPPPAAGDAHKSVWVAAAASGAARRVDPRQSAPVKPVPAVVPRPSPPPPPPAPQSEVSQKASDAPTLQLANVQAIDHGHTLAGEFRAWCAEQMNVLTGSTDVTLCEFLMTVESNSEIADYIATYLGTTPAVATFSAEFIKRKLVELATGKKSRKARAKARAKAAAAAATESSKSSIDVSQDQPDDSSWETVDTGRRRRGSDVSGREPAKSYSSGFAVLGGH